VFDIVTEWEDYSQFVGLFWVKSY